MKSALLILVVTFAVAGAASTGVSALFTESAGVGGNAFATDTLNPPTTPSSSGTTTTVLDWTATPDTYASGYRVFPPEAARRLRFIKRAQELGFSLSEIRDLLSLRVDKRTTPADVRKRAETKIADVGEKIRTLTRIKDALRTLSEQCSACGTLDECPILQTLDDVTDSEAMKR